MVARQQIYHCARVLLLKWVIMVSCNFVRPKLPKLGFRVGGGGGRAGKERKGK
jgi:hypothetical protein